MKILKKLKEFFRVQFCHAKYKILLKKLRKEIKKRKLRVLFYVTENQKWGYQSLYELFEQSNIFEPIIVVGILTSVHNGKDKTRNNLEENYQFFKTRNMNVEYGYKNGDYVDLKTFKPDIIFYEQPWELPSIHKPQKTSNYALTFYFPYGLSLFDHKNDFMPFFQNLIFINFIDSILNMKRFEKYAKKNLKNYIEVGYLKFDTYFEEKLHNKNFWKENNKIKIIYAPHHSFEKEGLQIATFQKNGQFILNLAKSHPETTWIFKPHPRFKFALLKNNIMTEEEIENYYKEWENIGGIYTHGDYFEIFKSSDLMITDCCSFLAEYLPTNKPIIRPTNPNGEKLNELGQKITQGYYEINTNKELKNIFIELVKNKNDIKKNKRKNLIKYIFDENEKSAEKIFNYLSKILKGEKNEL